MEKQEKYPAKGFVYYRDNHGDMIIAKIVTRSIDGHYLTVHPGWYAPEPVVSLPLRPITGNRKLNRVPLNIIEKWQSHAPR
jgi:hypothetical protein